jgi:hypothetical protein
MKIFVQRKVKYTLDNRTVEEVLPGEYEVPRQIDKEAANLMLTMGKAVIIPEAKVAPKKPKLTKKAPENKVLKAKESK